MGSSIELLRSEIPNFTKFWRIWNSFLVFSCLFLLVLLKTNSFPRFLNVVFHIVPQIWNTNQWIWSPSNLATKSHSKVCNIDYVGQEYSGINKIRPSDSCLGSGSPISIAKCASSTDQFSEPECRGIVNSLITVTHNLQAHCLLITHTKTRSQKILYWRECM